MKLRYVIISYNIICLHFALEINYHIAKFMWGWIFEELTLRMQILSYPCITGLTHWAVSHSSQTSERLPENMDKHTFHRWCVPGRNVPQLSYFLSCMRYEITLEMLFVHIFLSWWKGMTSCCLVTTWTNFNERNLFLWTCNMVMQLMIYTFWNRIYLFHHLEE